MNPLHGLPLLEDLPDIEGRRVLVRVDFNVPLHIGIDGRATVADDFRITAALPTLRWLQDHGAEVVAISHLGRPAATRDPRWEMDPVRERLAALCPGIELGENLRFSPGEKKPTTRPSWPPLIEGFDAYVNEAFGVAHRRHASIVGPPQFLPSAAGLRLAREIEVLGGILACPARPFVAVVGGAKVADKIEVLKALAPKVDTLIVGGGMAFTFLAALGQRVGSSLLDAATTSTTAGRCSTPASTSASPPIPGHRRPSSREPGCPSVRAPGWGQGDREGSPRRLDRPRYRARIRRGLRQRRAAGRHRPVERADGRLRGPAVRGGNPGGGRSGGPVRRVLGGGGGDSASALEELHLCDDVDFLSTGGGASLAFIERGGDLPALEALRQAPNAPAVISARRPLISGNWKMHHDHIEALHMCAISVCG